MVPLDLINQRWIIINRWLISSVWRSCLDSSQESWEESSSEESSRHQIASDCSDACVSCDQESHQESSRIIRNHQESLRTFKNPNGIHQLDPSIHFLPLSMIKCTVRYPKNLTKLSRILNEGQESPNSPQHQLNLIHFVPRIPKNLQESR